MVNYYCDRCGHESENKTHFFKHLNRKFTCKPLLLDVSINTIRNRYIKNSNHKVIILSSKVIKSNHTEFCKFCKKEFSCKQSVSRHELHYCKQNTLLNLQKTNNKLINENKLIKLEFEKQINKIKMEVDKLLIYNL